MTPTGREFFRRRRYVLDRANFLITLAIGPLSPALIHLDYTMRKLPLATAVIAAAVALSPPPAAAQSGSWSQATAGTYTWSTAGNWTGGTIADGANNTATFATASLTGPINANLDTSRTLGGLVFDNPSNTFGWTISGTNTLTL